MTCAHDAQSRATCVRPDRRSLHGDAPARSPPRAGHRRGTRRRAYPRQRRCGSRGVQAARPPRGGRGAVARDDRAAPRRRGPCVQAVAERLPFGDGAVDASLAILTIHHWTDQAAGLAELRRVARRRVVVLTFDPADGDGFWLTTDYFPEILALDALRFPGMATLKRSLGPARVIPVPVPHDCEDGFLGAFWRRPEAYLDPTVRRAMSGFEQIEPERLRGGLARLADDLGTGRWEARHEALRSRDSLDLGYRLIMAERG